MELEMDEEGGQTLTFNLDSVESLPNAITVVLTLSLLFAGSLGAFIYVYLAVGEKLFLIAPGVFLFVIFIMLANRVSVLWIHCLKKKLCCCTRDSICRSRKPNKVGPAEPKGTHTQTMDSKRIQTDPDEKYGDGKIIKEIDCV